MLSSQLKTLSLDASEARQVTALSREAASNNPNSTELTANPEDVSQIPEDGPSCAQPGEEDRPDGSATSNVSQSTTAVANTMRVSSSASASSSGATSSSTTPSLRRSARVAEGAGKDTLPPSAAERIASDSPYHNTHAVIELSQARFRVQVLNAWNRAIKPGMRVLEIGCGQGTFTAILAEAVGSTGHVDALDPASPTYGSPVNLGDSQAAWNNSRYGPRIAFHEMELEEFLLDTQGKTWDVAVMCLSMWYLESHFVLERIFHVLKGRVSHICTAEYDLNASHPAAIPHVMAAMVRGCREYSQDGSDANIRTPMGRHVIQLCGKRSGWEPINGGKTINPDEDLQDGSWEVEMLLDDADKLLKEITSPETPVDEQPGEEQYVWLSAAQAVRNSAMKVKEDRQRLRTMDVWVAVWSETGNDDISEFEPMALLSDEEED